MTQFRHLFSFDKKVAVVTGGTGILGSEFCRALCDLGASVACIDVQEDSMNSLIKELNDQYGDEKIAGFLCDISNQQSVSNTVADIIKRFSKIDILLNNAATKTKDINDFFTPFSDFSLNTWREVMSVNLDGMFLVAQAIGKHMVERRQGAIVQTASIYSLTAPDHRIYHGSYYLGREINTPAVYTASKAGVIGLTKHLATLWAEYGIRVNALCPGGVSSGQNNEFNKKYSERVPMGRMAMKIDIVGPMLFLVSNAAQYMTGQVIYADGGLSAW
ncbi:MAG TPA: SDR family oxidoreductase [Gammaproteobacteria bacterium]|nr:SDR family oxidoreductase [Gammaproteobacteria bacterium]